MIEFMFDNIDGKNILRYEQPRHKKKGRGGQTNLSGNDPFQWKALGNNFVPPPIYAKNAY